jgi:acetolactate synthase-1/2/3 large subunit
VSQADLIISIGVRWGQAVVGPNIENFAPQAKVIIIDIDEKELNRIPRKLNFTLKQCNALSLLQFLMKNDIPNLPINQNWLDYCNKIANYNHEQLFSNSSESIDQYQFISLIQKLVTIPTIFVIDGGGTIVYCSMQTLQKSNLVQVVIPSASCPMGTGIPQSIGAQIANKNNLVVTIIGDGSFTFNLQELQTIQTYKLPIKIIILNNDGYLSIKETQSKFQNSRFLGSDKCGGLELPSVAAIANAFGIKYRYIERYSDINNIFLEVFSSEKAEIIEVKIRHDQKIFPTLGFEKNTKGEFLTLPLSIMEPRINLPKFQ